MRQKTTRKVTWLEGTEETINEESSDDNDDNEEEPGSDTSEDTWGPQMHDSTDSIGDSEDSTVSGTENNSTADPTIETEQTEPAGTEQVGGDAQPDSTQPDSGWGTANEVQTCSSQDECSEERVCAATGQCLFPDDFGTSLEGEECATADQCAISLRL